MSCGQLSTNPSSGGSSSYDGVWLLINGRGPQGPIDTSEDEITLEIRGREVSGGMTCNSYSGAAEIDGDLFRVRVGSTQIGCSNRFHKIDDSYLAALGVVDKAERQENELALSGSRADLKYQFVPPPPDAELVGTPWRINSLLYGPDPSSLASSAARASLIFKDDGTMSGSTSCRNFTAQWERNDGEILVQKFSPSGPCERNRKRDQDRHLIEVLSDGFAFKIDGMRLEILANDGELGAFYSAPCRFKPAVRCSM
jgi:heat shock protein HslJ